MKTILLGDTHHKYTHRAAMAWAIRQIRNIRPDVVVQVGDLYDRRAYSRFNPSMEPGSPMVEDEQSRRDAVEMWERIQQAAPRAKRYQLWGNHDEFPIKRTWERFPQAEGAVRKWLREQMTFKGVETTKSYRDVVPLPDGWAVTHGYTSNGKHAAREGRNIERRKAPW